MSHIRKIRFNGEDFLLIGGLRDGAIATREQFENFDVSYAHLMEDGNIKQFGAIIGTIDDIEFGEIEE